MDLRAVLNESDSLPPRRPSQASPIAPSPVSIPAPLSAIAATPPLAPLQATSAALKRKKLREKPIWAQKWSPNWRSMPWAAALTVATPVTAPRQSPLQQRPPSSQRPNGSSRETNTQSPANTAMSAPPTSGGGYIKQWEANILDRVPLDQMSRSIADFLFSYIVSVPEPGPGAAFEVEAKLGHLINQVTNERLHLPVITDCILNKEDPSMRTAFKSTMTELQHRAFNEFLNDALMRSLPPKPPHTPAATPRIPISYKHTRQTDVFYELTPDASSRLPPSILGLMGNRAKARVRVTTDQKTGQELAKIIKIRIADLDVHSPRTLFDWRMSINIEINYNGPTQGLVKVMERGQPSPPRNKDRMTYNHLAYQIDLTQVTMPGQGQEQNKEHELEVEISRMDELRKQGQLLQSGQENTYEQIIRGFVDNVRLLQRQIPVDH